LKNREQLTEVYAKATLIQNFEEKVIEFSDKGKIDIPVYLGLGQEYIAATVSVALKNDNPGIFTQHRAHSYYLAFGGDPQALFSELQGDELSGCAKGFGGSVGIYSKDINFFGHTGLMGEQVYLGVGWSFATKRKALIVLGDATIEEDYVFPSIGFAVTHKLKTIFICEDNGLAVLTPTSKRRSWKTVDVVKAFGVNAFEIQDDPVEILNILENYKEEGPLFLNILTQRKNRHVGAKLEGDLLWDRHSLFKDSIIKSIPDINLNEVEKKSNSVIESLK
jgi:TPP-dependent pyruvate/acetoin dehydrogenase alpha subunit